MTAVKFAKAMDVDYSTVMRWLKSGLVPGAVQEETPMGNVWQIPESALKMTRPLPGRKKEAVEAQPTTKKAVAKKKGQGSR